MTEPLKQAPRIRPESPTRTQGTVKIIYGVHSLEVDIAGRSVAEVRDSLKQALNIGPRAIAIVDGREVMESHILQTGEILEFVRLAGEKGSGSLVPDLGVSPQTP
ncbi:MAG: hypothetical protein FVQ06_00180 [candidate division NC10 bacterium]|nr:hypothetical protein [candidate division NC10 bacterium]